MRNRGRLSSAGSKAAVLLLVSTLVAAAGAAWWQQDSSDSVLRGLVVGGSGQPVPGAVVRAGNGETATTDANGQFTLPGEPTWVTVSAQGWVTRTRALGGGDPTTVRLVRDRPGTVTLSFAGDVMFGRRYFDPAEDGSMTGLLDPDDDRDAHADLLEGVSPLLSEADLTAVNLETPLVSNPAYDVSGVRPSRFHPTKDYAFASAPAAAGALADLGVDVVDIGNNHLFDRRGAGVTATRRALTAAELPPGKGSFGAGRDADAAWQPAVQKVAGQTVALLGCTSITGDDQPLTYVATDGKGGAARCAPSRLRREVQTAARTADIVVAMVHGGYEYGRRPSAQVRRLSDVAVAAGATMVINHHPHVVGGLRYADGGLTAWTLGNLLFDQTVWPTFESYILTVVVRNGRVVGAWTEPVRLQNYQPTGVYGADADWVARGALPRSQGPWVVDDGSLWLDTVGAGRTTTYEPETSAGLLRLDGGCAPGAGRELLWTGDFEDRDLQPDTASTTTTRAEPRPAALWNATAEDPYRRWGPGDGRTGAGVRLHRADRHEDDVLLNPIHRVLVGSGDRLTLLVDLRAAFGRPTVTLQLSWYNDTRGGSQAQTIADVPVTSQWRTYRVDIAAPRRTVAVTPYVRLSPPEDDVVQAQVDNVRLINFDEAGCDYLDAVTGAVTATRLPPHAPDVDPVSVTATELPAQRPRSLPAPPPERRGVIE